MQKLLSADRAASLIKDEAIITVSSSSGLGCPDALLKALGERHSKEGAPRNITSVHPIAAGDMYGIKGIDHIAQKGLLTRAIAGSYPSGPSSLPMPAIWRMITEDELAAYNLPSGVLFDMHREAARGGPGVLTQVGMDTYVDPNLEGGAMNAQAAAAPLVKRVKFAEEEWLFFPVIKPDLAFIRATTADTRGNLSYEHEGALLGALDQALAARNNGGIVIAQVKRVVEHGSLNARQVHVPGHLVDYVVIDAEQKQTTQTQHDPAICGEVRMPWRQLDARLPHSVEKVIARRAAMELRQGDVANLGFGISAMVPYILAEEGMPESVTWVIEQGAVGGLPRLDFAFGCSANADAIIPSPSQFNFFQGGGFDASFLSFLEVDTAGNVNVSKLAKRPYLTAGCGGFVDIINKARKIVFSGLFAAGAELDLGPEGIRVIKPGKFNKFVSQVEQVSFAGQRAVQQGQDVIYITERCVMKLTQDGLLITEKAPGIDLQKDVLQQMDAKARVADEITSMPNDLFGEGLFGLSIQQSDHPH